MTRRTPPTSSRRNPAQARHHEQGFGALNSNAGNLPLTDLQVDARVCDVTAHTFVWQTFHNSHSQPLEATYIFPLPSRAAVTHFQLQVGERTVVGELQERGQARQNYDHAIRNGHRAAIAEEERSGVFTMRAGNILPGETVHVELQMTGPLPVTGGETEYRFPLVVAPRYTPGIPLTGTDCGTGTARDTDQVPDASRVTPPTLLPGFSNPVRLQVEVEIDAPQFANEQWFDSITCEMPHQLAHKTRSSRLVLQPGERLDRDLIIRFPAGNPANGQQEHPSASLVVSPCAAETPGQWSLTVFPPAGLPTATEPRDIVFLLDRSGSMSGWKMIAARRALGRMIDALPEQDRFVVTAFDTHLEHHQKQLTPATNRNRWQALEWLSKIQARGGTEMGSAISEAQRILAATIPGDTQNRLIVLITDGQVSGEDVLLKQFAKGTPARVHAVGIDQAVNAGFLQRLTSVNGGQCELVESEDRLDIAMQKVCHLLCDPVLRNVRVVSSSADLVSHSTTPGCATDVFVDRPLVISGRHLASEHPLTLHITGELINGETWTAQVDSTEGDAAFLRPIWGRSLVREMEDRYAASTNSDVAALARQIVDVSLECGVLSRFTAFVAVDRTEVVNQGGVSLCTHSSFLQYEMQYDFYSHLLSTMHIHHA